MSPRPFNRADQLAARHRASLADVAEHQRRQPPPPPAWWAAATVLALLIWCAVLIMAALQVWAWLR